MQQLFTPYSKTALLACTTMSARVAIPTDAPAPCRTLRIKNVDTTNVAYIARGDSSVVAVVPTNGTNANGMPIGPGETVGITMGDTDTHIAGITSSNTANLLITRGKGN